MAIKTEDSDEITDFNGFVKAVKVIVASKTSGAGIDLLAGDFDYSSWWDDDLTPREALGAAKDAAGTFLYDLGLGDQPY